MKASIFIAKDKLINDYKTKVTALGCELDCVYEDFESAVELARKSGSFIICYDDEPVKEIYRMYAEARHLKYIQEKLKEKGYVWTEEDIQKALDNSNFKDIIDNDVWQVVQTYKAVKINDPRKAEFSDRAFTGILFCGYCGLPGKPMRTFSNKAEDDGEPLGDETYAIYVNGTNEEDTELGKLMRDLKNPNPDTMNYELLSNVVGYFKKTEKGRNNIMTTTEKLCNLARLNTLFELAKEGTIAIEIAAQKAKMSVQEFSNQMKLAGYTL